jgi:malonyl-CoA O-methyltransferase
VSDDDGWRLELGAVRRSFERASAGYDAHAVLQGAVRGELLRRLELLAFEPAVVVDLGAGTGHGARALRERWRRARVVALDVALGMLHAARAPRSWRRHFDRVGADAARLPFRDASVDLAFSNLMLPWAVDLDVQLAEVRRVLRPRGYFTFSTLGPDTLYELRAAWASVDGDSHVNRFLDLHDIGDALVRAGFADSVMDLDRHTLTYADARALMRDLKANGAHNVTAARPAALTGRGRLLRVEAAYERFRRADGRLPATCEVVYGQAWCPGAAPPLRARRGETAIPLADLGGRRRQSLLVRRDSHDR